MRLIKTGLAIATGLLLLPGLSATAASASAASAVPAATITATSAATTRINGKLYYDKYTTTGSAKFLSYRNGKLRTVLNGYEAYFAEFSPDGKRLAYVTETGRLRVSNADGTHVRKLSLRVASAGCGPNWTADGKGLIVCRSSDYKAGVVQVSNGKFTALPRSIRGIHYRMTGDGKRYLWSDGTGGIWSARVNGTGVKRVPVLGKKDRTNPKRLRAYDIVSTNRDGSRITVDLLKGNDNDGDIGSGEVADAVINTETGKALALPVRGSVSQVLYLSNGKLLVRSGPARKLVLTLLSANGKVLASKTEPAALRNLTLRDYLV